MIYDFLRGGFSIQMTRGKGGIVFEKTIVRSPMRNPKLHFIDQAQEIEYRKDPLLGYWVRINKLRAKRPHHSGGEESIREFAERMKPVCPFCKNLFELHAPKMPKYLFEEDRVEFGTLVVFPNLYPFAPFHWVAVVREKHYMELREIRAEHFKDLILVTRRLTRQVLKEHPEAIYVWINFNFLPPAGASIIHPHFQIVQDFKPSNMLQSMLKASEIYYNNYGSSYWEDLIATEREMGERFIMDGEHATWIASYAPVANGEVLGVVRDYSSVLEMSDDDVWGLAKEMERIVHGMYAMGVRSINMSIYNSPLNRKLSFFRALIKIVRRGNPAPWYTNDRAFMEILHEEPVLVMLPEDVAEKLREQLKSDEGNGRTA